MYSIHCIRTYTIILIYYSNIYIYIYIRVCVYVYVYFNVFFLNLLLFV